MSIENGVSRRSFFRASCCTAAFKLMKLPRYAGAELAVTSAIAGTQRPEVTTMYNVVMVSTSGKPSLPGRLVTSTISVSPSALESFSLVVLEAWVDRVPVVVNGTCAPTREHCVRSGGGLWFTSYPEFEATLDRLLSDAGLRATLGANGRAYVDRFYQWPLLIRRYAAFLDEVRQRGRAPVGVL